MGKINREELFKILDTQYEAVKSHIANHMDLYIERLHDYQGDVIDIKTEISMGNTLDDSLFKSVDEDYYDKQKLLSSESVPTPKWDKLHTESDKQFDKITTDFWRHYEPNKTTTVTAPTKEQFTHEELRKLLDMTVSLILFFREKYGNDNMKYQDIMSIYKKILELL